MWLDAEPIRSFVYRQFSYRVMFGSFDRGRAISTPVVEKFDCFGYTHFVFVTVSHGAGSEQGNRKGRGRRKKEKIKVDTVRQWIAALTFKCNATKAKKCHAVP